MDEHDPVVLTCHLCITPDDGLILTTVGRHWYAAIDHAIDHHLAVLVEVEAEIARSFTLNRSGRARRLRPGRLPRRKP
ncbi:hypothetical protein [Pseudonocardia sp. T1-2H]|uniref:hypothetical protein n=1 Tax=Pseudonocardia sp. T1-2H TaxID=3128899 RepID=UPI003100E253